MSQATLYTTVEQGVRVIAGLHPTSRGVLRGALGIGGIGFRVQALKYRDCMMRSRQQVLFPID